MSEDKKRIHVVINPASGQDEPILNTLNDMFNKHDIDWSASITKKYGDATEFARKAAESGGDNERRTITMTTSSDTRTVTITKAQEMYVSWYVDVLIYTVVLNLFVEYSEAVKIDSFTLSVLTALLLKLILVFLERIEGRVHHYFEQKAGTVWKVVGFVVTITILILGKLFILEAVNFVFGDRVELGHFVEVLVLILAMIVTRAIAVWFYKRLGNDDEAEQGF